MVHHRQGLAFGLEAGDHLLGVHTRLDELQRHAPPHRLDLLGHINHAATSFADLLEQLVASDGLPDEVIGGRVREVQGDGGSSLSRSSPEQRVRLVMGGEQGLESGAQGGIPDALAVQERGAPGPGQGQGGLEEGFFVGRRVHDSARRLIYPIRRNLSCKSIATRWGQPPN
jgi:hypothetical protein